MAVESLECCLSRAISSSCTGKQRLAAARPRGPTRGRDQAGLPLPSSPPCSPVILRKAFENASPTRSESSHSPLLPRFAPFLPRAQYLGGLVDLQPHPLGCFPRLALAGGGQDVLGHG